VITGREQPPGRCVNVTDPETVSQEASSQQKPASRGEKRRRRRSRRHTWPEVGTILEADYHGEHYEAEVMEARRYKSGRALKVLTGPAAGRGAMLAATEHQRADHGLGKKGVSNGWEFWKRAGKEKVT